MKALSILFWILAVLLSNVMCGVVAYSYCDILWQTKTYITSAPASVAFIYAIPFAIGILICVILALRFSKKAE